MFGKKKKDAPAGICLMHYEGLQGFPQDGPCSMEQTEEALVFRRKDGPTVTLPLSKITGLDIMEEPHFAAQYRGTGMTTSRTNAVKWFAVFKFTSEGQEKHLAFWFLGGKESKALWDLKKGLDSAVQDYTL